MKISESVNSYSIQQHPSKKRQAVAVATGGLVAGVPLAKLAHDSLKLLDAKSVQQSATFLQRLMPDPDSFDNTMANAEKILDKSGLGKKGVKIFVSDNTPEKDHLLDKMFGKYTNITVIKNFKNAIKYAGNAAFLSDKNTVITSDKALYTSVYHELGHASNYAGKITKILQKARILTPMGLPIIAPLVLGVSLLHNVDKTKNSEDKNKKEKTLDFVSKNVGKLTLATYIPMLAEEALASVKGLKFAKPLLQPTQFKKLAGNYTKAFGTYASTAVIVSGLVGLASIVSNKIKNGGSHKNSEHSEVSQFQSIPEELEIPEEE